MYRYAIQEGVFIIYHQGPIKTPLGYYARAASTERSYTLNLLSQLPANSYLDGCCSTGIRGLRATTVVPTVFLNDAYADAALINLNRALNPSRIVAKLYRQDICALPEVAAVLDLDVYGSSLHYLLRMPGVAYAYLFLTFTDLMNVCGWPAYRFFDKFDTTYRRGPPSYQVSVRLLLGILARRLTHSYNVLAVYRHQKYLRVYLARGPAIPLAWRYGCSCGLYTLTPTVCRLCTTSRMVVGPLSVEPLGCANLHGFDKIAVFRGQPMPSDHYIVHELATRGITAKPSPYDQAYFCIPAAVSIYNLEQQLLAIRKGLLRADC